MPRFLDPTTLRYFVAICDEGNIALAAEREAIVASAISKRIAALEADLGVTLFVRDRRFAKPTAAGDALLKQAREILSMMERTRSELSEFTKGVHGSVRVLAGLSALTEFLPEGISSFLATHDAVRVSLEERVASEIIRGVTEGSADMGICWDACDTGELQTFPYRQDHLCLVCHRDHPLATLDELRFEQTLNYDQIGVIRGSLMDSMLRRNANQFDKQLTNRVQVTTFDAACKLAAANLGVAILPQEAINHSYCDRLKRIPLTDDWATRRFIIAVRSVSTLSNAAKSLLQHLREGDPGTPESLTDR